MSHWLVTACGQCPTGILGGIDTNIAKCPPNTWEVVCLMEEGCFQVSLQIIHSSTFCWNGKTRLVLPAKCWVWCAHYGHEYVHWASKFWYSLTLVIVLDPSKKMSYFRKHWPSNLVSDVEEVVQNRVRFYYSILNTDQLILMRSSSNNSTQRKPTQVPSACMFTRPLQYTRLPAPTLTIQTQKMILTVVKPLVSQPTLGWTNGRHTLTLLRIYQMAWASSAGGGYDTIVTFFAYIPTNWYFTRCSWTGHDTRPGAQSQAII